MNCVIQLIPQEHGVWAIFVFLKHVCLELGLLYSNSKGLLYESICGLLSNCSGDGKLA